MGQISIRRRLPRDAFLVLSAYLVVHALQMTSEYGLGWDAHAYYSAWSGDLYEAAPGEVDAYNYSPLFAQLIWPLTHLPWPVFCVLWVGAAGVTIAWLVRPLPWPMAVGTWLFCTPEILSGNVFWLLALCAVLGLRRGSPWCVAAFTKILPCVGPVWFLLRGEWRRLAGFAATALGLLAASYALDPGLWRQWVDFLADNVGGTTDIVYTPPLPIHVPLVVRLLVSAAVLVYAARTNRPWMLPVAMLLACPVVGWGSFALLAAIPRLRRVAAAPTATKPDVPAPEARRVTP